MWTVQVLIDDPRFLSGNWGYIKSSRWQGSIKPKFSFFGKRSGGGHGTSRVSTFSILDVKVVSIPDHGVVDHTILYKFESLGDAIKARAAIRQYVAKGGGKSNRKSRRALLTEKEQGEIRELMQLFPFPPHST